MKQREEIFGTLVELFVELFETDPSDIRQDSQLFDDLDIDSIDAVDLVVRLKEITGKKIDPQDFKAVRTVGDVVETVYVMLNSPTAPAE